MLRDITTRFVVSALVAASLVACNSTTPTPAPITKPPTSNPSNPTNPTNPTPPTTPNPPEPAPPAPVPNPGTPVSGKLITYQASSENFLNPERGLHFAFQLHEGNDYRSMRTGNVYRDANGEAMPVSVIFAYIRLSDYRDASIPDSYLNHLRGRLEAVRAAGVKIMLRSYYSFGIGQADAPIGRVLEHIRQLGPLFREFEDVIFAVEGGFIGAWGEWHSSTNDLTSSTNRRQIIEALLAAVPSTRPVVIRYIRALTELYPNPMSDAQGFSGTAQARLGIHNDCFLANHHDAGTYGWGDGRTPAAADTGYAMQITKYTPMIGETCQIGWGTGPGTAGYTQRSDCPTTLAEMRRYHWSVISGNWYEPVITRWKRDGCYNEIVRRLGYRFRLVKATIPETLTRTDRLKMSFEVYNEGFAALFNARGAQIILRNKTTRAVVALSANTDPRRWGPGETTAVALDMALPSNIAAGEYEILLNLPDVSPRLASRPEYSIRLANQNLWEATTGYNSLQASIRIQ